MQKTQIVKFLNDNDLSDVEILRSESELLLVNFYFDFDKDLLDAAKAYANDESNHEENSKEWLNDYYFAYLYDFANDEVLEIVEEITEDFDVQGEMMAFQITEKTSEYVQFMVLFTEEESDISIEEVVREYMSK